MDGINVLSTSQNSVNCKTSEVLTCVNPGEGAGFGTEEGPVIGCGGLFISRYFVVLHQCGVVLPAFLKKPGKMACKEKQNYTLEKTQHGFNTITSIPKSFKHSAHEFHSSHTGQKAVTSAKTSWW